MYDGTCPVTTACVMYVDMMYVNAIIYYDDLICYDVMMM